MKKILETDKNYSDTDFRCNECNFKGKNKNGLKVHKSLKHTNIIQIDGNDNTEFEKETETRNTIKNEKK